MSRHFLGPLLLFCVALKCYFCFVKRKRNSFLDRKMLILW